MKNKIIALLLAFVTLLSGCGAEEAGEQKQMKEQNQEQNQVSTEITEYEKPEMKGEITVSTMVEHEFLKTAAEKFMTMYPEITITINSYQGSTGENADVDYRTYLNTKIMSGKAEDIIFTTQLPVKKYMDMGVFEDLSHYVSVTPEINEENYFLNVLKASKDDKGNLFILPYMSSFRVISFDKDVVSESGEFGGNADSIRYSEAIQYAKQAVEKSQLQNVFLLPGKNVSYIDELVYEFSQALINVNESRANIDTEQYIGWLRDVKEMDDNGDFNSANSIDYYNEEYHFAMLTDYDVQAAFYNLTGNLCKGGPIADELGNVYTNSAYCVGINSASQNKSIAWEFIKYLLSEEIQSLPSIYGLAVNKKGFDASVNRYLKFYQDGTSISVDFDEYKSLLAKWVSEINKCDLMDPSIINYIDEENSKFFENLQSAEKTAQVLQSKITQYLSE